MSEEARRKEILQVREEHKKLSDMILAGTEWAEPVTVRGIDGRDHEVDVYTISDYDFREMLRTAGVDPADIGNREKLLANMDFMAKLAAAATRDPNISKVLVPGEIAKTIAPKVLQYFGPEVPKK